MFMTVMGSLTHAELPSLESSSISKPLSSASRVSNIYAINASGKPVVVATSSVSAQGVPTLLSGTTWL